LSNSSLSYTYDAAGNVASIKSSNANGVWASYTYDDMGRLGTVVDSRLQGQQTTTYSYDAASNLATAAYPNNSISNPSAFTYDSLNRLTALASPVSSYNYTLGATGNRTKAIEGTGRTLNWSYDGIYRLTNETISADPANKDGVVAYTLDSVGNRKAIASTLSGVNSGGTFSYNTDDELSTDLYDNNGDTLSTGGKNFSYDSENHLMGMNAGTVTLLYDGDGNRVAKTVGGVTTRYLVDDMNPTGLPQVVDELVGGAVTRQYTYGLDRISENQFVGGAWTPSFYGVDGGGSVRQLTNSSGTVTDTYEYDAFGNKVNSTGTTPNNYLYGREQYDTDLSLYYLRARYYNPTTGRFLNVDPLAGQGQRRYEYAGANPVDGSDPSGNFVLASYWPQMAALQIHIPLPSWCGAGSTGPIGSHLPPCRPRLRHVVKEMEDGKPIKGYWASKGNFVERDVTYWAYDLEPDGSRGYRDTNDTISLIEKTAAGSNVGTCSSVQACPGTPREFVDDQRVFQHAPFTVQRYWYVGGIQALVWNAKTDNSTAPFETLRLDYDANPTFAITYGK